MAIKHEHHEGLITLPSRSRVYREQIKKAPAVCHTGQRIAECQGAHACLSPQPLTLVTYSDDCVELVTERDLRAQDANGNGVAAVPACRNEDE